MNIPWKMIVVVALVATLGLSAFDFFYAAEDKSDFVKYQTEEITSNLNESVLRHIAESSKGRVLVRSNEIVKKDEN